MRKKRHKILSSNVSVARATTIDNLPDDALLQIFDFCQMVDDPLDWSFRPGMEWQRLIHVSRRWLLIIFLSPRRLDLYLLCKPGTPVRQNLDVWPAFPIIIDYFNYSLFTSQISPDDDDDIIAALEHRDKVAIGKGGHGSAGTIPGTDTA